MLLRFAAKVTIVLIHWWLQVSKNARGPNIHEVLSVVTIFRADVLSPRIWGAIDAEKTYRNL